MSVKLFTFLCFFAHLGIQLNLGDDGFLLTPKTSIVGYLRGIPGASLMVCGGNAQNPKECYPNVGRNYKAGDVIDFSWTMNGLVSVVLIYAIDPSG